MVCWGLRGLSAIVNQGVIEAMLNALVGRGREVEGPANRDVAWRRRAGGAGWQTKRRERRQAERVLWPNEGQEMGPAPKNAKKKKSTLSFAAGGRGCEVLTDDGLRADI
jgi:hypothetical protein